LSIGEPQASRHADKIAAFAETDEPDHATDFTPSDAPSRRITGQVIDFLEHEVARGRLPGSLLPIQVGWGTWPTHCT
jgi:succinyl-CoA:acetate CoA-transferase